MRILYFGLFLLFTISVSSQQRHDFQNSGTKEISEVKLYPNPAFGGVVNVITRANTLKQISLYDVFGEVVLTDKINSKALDISRLAPGIYVMQINEGKKTMTRKLVVK